jgi:hypothetical protein
MNGFSAHSEIKACLVSQTISVPFSGTEKKSPLRLGEGQGEGEGEVH